MYRFFVDKENIKNSPVTIKGDDYNHIKNVLRLKTDDILYLSDGSEREYKCKITRFDEIQKTVILDICDIIDASRELPAKITLFQGYAKGDKMETIVQKAVELGAYEIVPVMMRRCVVKLDEKKAEKKIERLNAVSLSAAKQAKRMLVPKVTEVMTLEKACNYAKDMDYILLPYENADGMEYSKKIIEKATDKNNIAVFIGPEGGFDESEVLMIESIGGHTFSLGHRILRTETAGMTVLSLLMFLLDRDGGKDGSIF